MSTKEYFKNKFGIESGEIKGVDRLDFIHWLRELDFKVGAEIGVYVGEYSRLICRCNPQLTLYGVDSWVNHPDYRELQDEEFENLYKETKWKLRREINKGQFRVIRKTSMEALKDFKDGSLDFVYIDANHEDPFVTQDIEGWAKKVRAGGIVAGHDYIDVKPLKYAIKKAVNKYCAEHNKPLFILGAEAKEPKVVRDRVRSWCFIN